MVADVNVEGHFQHLLRLLQSGFRSEYWDAMNLRTPTFRDLGWPVETPDLDVWRKCQEEQLILVTANRNAEGSSSLEMAIRTPHSLPVITLADADRILQDRAYAERVADRTLEYLFEIDRVRGCGRLYVP